MFIFPFVSCKTIQSVARTSFASHQFKRLNIFFMTPFEYVIVLISIILGMGITQIVSGLADMIHRWERVKVYWPHLVLVIIVFFIQIQEWWVTYDMRNYEYWRLPTFLFIILYPVNLYILARLLFPVSWRGKVIDMKEFYFQNSRRIYLFTITLDSLGVIDNIFIANYTVQDQIIQFIVMALLIFVVAKDNKNELLHKTIVLLLLFITVAYMAITLIYFPEQSIISK